MKTGSETEVKKGSIKKRSRPGTATQQKGQQRVAEVLAVAADILIEEGYSELTIRKVAARANMKHGNLQYYFPTKDDLLSAMLQHEFERYKDVVDARFNNNRYTPRQKLIFAIDYILRDQMEQRSCAIFWELWALSSHDAQVARVLNAYYDNYLSAMVSLIRQINPDLSVQKAGKIGVLIVAMLEGLSLFRGYNKPQSVYLRGIEKELREVVINLVGESGEACSLPSG